MPRSVGYRGGGNYGYPSEQDYGGGGGGQVHVTPLGASDETLSSITELAQIVRKRREAEEAKAREAEAEFRRITIDVPEGFVTRAKQQIGGNTPEHKIAAAVTAQKMWDEEKARQKHAADVSKQIEESTKEAERSAKEIRQEGTKRREDLMKLEADRQTALAKWEASKQQHGVKAAKARQRDEMAAARLGEAYNPAVHSTFDEDAPEMPSRTVYVYDADWNIVGSQQLPVTDSRNFIRTGSPGAAAEIFPESGQPGGAVPSAPRPPAQGAMPRPPAGAPREPAGGGGMSLAEITRQSVLAKKAAEEEKAAETDRVKWNKAVQTTAAALRQNRALSQRMSQALAANPEAAMSATKLPMEDADVIAEKWDWSVGEPPSPEEIASGAALRRQPSKAQLAAQQKENVAGTDAFFGRLRQPEGAAPPHTAPDAGVPLETPPRGAAPSAGDTRYAQFMKGVETQAARMGSPAESAAYTERMLRNYDATNGVPENWINVRSEARRIARTQSPEAGQAFLSQMLQRLQPHEAGALAKAGAWTLRLGLPLAAGAGAGLVSGGTLALPAGAAFGLLGEDLARRLEGTPPMTPGEVGIVGALGMVPGGTGAKLTTQSLKQAAMHSAAAGAALGAVGSATLPAVGSNPQLPTLGGVATGAATGAVLGGVLGAAITHFLPGAPRQVQEAVASDPKVRQIAAVLEQTPPADRRQLIGLLEARIAELNQPGNPDFIGPVRTMEDQMMGATPETFLGPPPPTVEQRFSSSPADDLFNSMLAEAGKLSTPGGRAPQRPLGKPTGLREGQEALADPALNQRAKEAAQKAELDALVAKHPWMRANRGEAAAPIGEPLQGPLLPGQTSVAQPVAVTPGGIQLPEGVQPPSPRAVEAAGTPRAPGSLDSLKLWLDSKGIPAREWEAMIQNPEAEEAVTRLLAEFNAEQKATPKPPSFRSWLEGQGISKQQWDLLLNAEDPQSVARADQIINDYNNAHGLTAEGPLSNPALSTAPAGARPARNVAAETPRTGFMADEGGLSNLMGDRIAAAADAADAKYPPYLAGTAGERVVRNRAQVAQSELEALTEQVQGARANAAEGSARVRGKNEPATVAAGAEIMRAQQAIAAAEEALARGGVTTTKRWENTAKRAQGEGGGAQPFEEVPLSVAGNPDPQQVPRGTFDVALQGAEDAIGAVRAVRTATKNNPDVANQINAAVRELEAKLTTLRAAQQVGRQETRPVAALRQTAEALKLTRDGLVANPQDRNLAQRARMLTARLVDLTRVGGRNRYRPMRGPDGQWYVLREATGAGEVFEGKLGALKERALAGPFSDAEQATSFSAELEARWADVDQALSGDWPEGMPEPTLPKGQRGRGRETTATPVSQFPDERAVRRAETLSAKQLQEEWATAGRAMPGGRWQFGGAVPPRALGKSKAVESGRMRKPTPSKLGRTAKQMAAEDAATAALKLSPQQRAALSMEGSPPFEAAGGGAQAEFLGIPSAFRMAGKVAGNRYVKALVMGPRHTLKVLTEDFGAAGRKIAQDFLEYQDTYHNLAGGWKNELQQALGLLKTKVQAEDLVQVLEDSSLMGATDPEVQLAASTIRTSLDEVAILAQSNNRFAKYLNDYFPRYALERPDFKKRAEMLAENLWNSKFHRDRMVSLGAADAKSPEAISYAATQILSPHVSGLDAKNVHLEKARSSTHGLAYRTDPEVMFQYFDAAARSIAQAKHFDRPLPGTGGQPSIQRLGSLKKDLGDLELANPASSDRIRDLRYALERELGFREPGHEPGLGERLSGDIRDFVASSRLMASFITQTGSLADTANTFGWKGVGAALRGMGNARSEENAVRAGSASAAAEHAARETAMLLRGGGGAQGGSPISKLVRGHKWIGPDAIWMDWMVKVDRQQRIGADSAARATMPHLVEDLAKGNNATINLLREAGVSEKLLVDLQQLSPSIIKRHLEGKSIPADDLRVIDAYARRMTDFSQQRPSPSNLPPSWSTPVGRWMTMFMPFSLRQTQNMAHAIKANPARFLAAGAPAYIIMGGLVNAMKGFLSGYGIIGTNDSNRTTIDKVQQVLSNRPVAPDSPEDVALRVAQALAAAGPKPFAITVGEKLERGLESVPDAVMALTGPTGSALLSGPSALVRGAAGVGQPKGMGRGEYAARGAASAAAHTLLPSTFSYQIQRELMPPEGQFARKMRPPHRPGWVGRAADLPGEAERIGVPEAAKNFLLGGALGTEQYLSPRRKERKRNIEEWKRKEQRASAGAR